MPSFLKPIRESFFYCLNLWGGQLDCESLLSQAMRKTGLSDWGDLPFLEPFHKLVESLHREARLSQRGHFVLVQHYSRLLRNILQIVEDWKRYPEIAAVPIEDPIFIIGFPRTGTTFLHGLLAQDSAFRALRYWELLFPSPPPGCGIQAGDTRIRQAKQFVWGINLISPELASIHELDAMSVEECCFIFDHFFLDNIHHLVFDIPSYIHYYDRHDPVPSYRFHRRMLQYYAWKSPFDRFVLKAPRHLYCLEALLTVYPNARILWTHRDPVEAIPSLCSLSETARRIVSDDIDRNRIGQQCLEYFAKDFAAGYRARERANPRQIFDVSYRDLVHCPVEMVERIYEYFGFSFSESFVARLRHSIEDSRNQKTQKHRYSLEPYNLQPAEIEERLYEYYRLFETFI